MRLGLLGPSLGDLAGLARAAEFLLNGAKVTRAIYLGADQALEETVERWAQSLVGDEPSDARIWRRAIGVALLGGPEELDAFLRAERGRMRLRALESLPRDGLRSAEMIGDRMAVLIHDKALLDEDDIFAATFLVYGKSDSALLKQIGARWFLTPGPIGCAGGGAAVIEDGGDLIQITVYDAAGTATQHESIPVGRTAKLRVLGENRP